MFTDIGLYPESFADASLDEESYPLSSEIDQSAFTGIEFGLFPDPEENQKVAASGQP